MSYQARLSLQDLFHTAWDDRSVETVPADFFGAIQTGFAPFSGFDQSVDYMNVQHVRWPGGTLSELYTDVYGLEIDDLFDGTQLYNPNPNRDRPGLSDMLAYCVENDLSFSLIVPTFRYRENPEEGVQAVRDFMTRLVNGEYGELPSELTIEIGNEYATDPTFAADPSEYAGLADMMIPAIAEAREAIAEAYPGTELLVAIQIGRHGSEDEAIRETFSNEALSEIDSLVTHQLIPNYNNIGGEYAGSFTEDRGLTRLERVEQYYANWIAHIEANTDRETPPELYLSAWSTGRGAGEVDDVLLDYQDYGLQGAATALETMYTFLSAGVDAAAVWGVNAPNLNRMTELNGGTIDIAPTAAIFSMLSNAVIGATADQEFVNHNAEEGVRTYAFVSEEKQTIYVSLADEIDGTDAVSIDLSEFLPYIENIELKRLTARLPEDLQNHAGTETEEVYELAEIVIEEANLNEGILTLDFMKQYEIFEIQLHMNEDFSADYQPDRKQKLYEEVSPNPIAFANEQYGGEGDDKLVGSAANDLISGSGGQ